jgi:hypothetical protein
MRGWFPSDWMFETVVNIELSEYLAFTVPETMVATERAITMHGHSSCLDDEGDADISAT